jgi:hypothetical protein
MVSFAAFSPPEKGKNSLIWGFFPFNLQNQYFIRQFGRKKLVLYYLRYWL